MCAYWVSLIHVCLNFHWLPLTNTSLNFHHSTSSSSLFIWPAVHSLARQCCALNSTVLAASSCSDDPLDAARVSSQCMGTCVYLCYVCTHANMTVCYIVVWTLKCIVFYIHCMCTFAYKFLGVWSGMVK